MRQTGVIAACGLVALEDWHEKLTIDHSNASFLAHELAEIPGIIIDPKTVETNILYFTFENELKKKIGLDYRGFMFKMKEEHNILCNAGFNNDYIRFVTHRDVSRA